MSLARVAWRCACFALFTAFCVLMLLGGPFESFDHQNYINFLAEPFPFFFEPLYTALAYLIAEIAPPDARFFLSFLFFVSVPTVAVLFSRRCSSNGEPIQRIYFWIFLKSSFIGFISQRFWFAELWMCAVLLIYYQHLLKIFFGLLLASGVHFGILGVMPIIFFLKRSVGRLFLATIVLTIAFVFYVKLNNYVFFGYDYSRYVGMGEERGFPYFSLITMIFICGFSALASRRDLSKKIITAALCCLLVKILFYDLDVYSRIFQAQVDLLLILIAWSGRRFWVSFLLPIFCISFVGGILLLTSPGLEVAFYFEEAIFNIFDNF